MATSEGTVTSNERPSRSVVAVYTGPHHGVEEETGDIIICKTPEECEERDRSRCLKRIRRGLERALFYKAYRIKVPLIVCGDGNWGDDVCEFVRLAYTAGIEQVYGFAFMDGREPGTTKEDAIGLAKLLRDRPELQTVDFVELVTDEKHGRRAKIITKGELTRLLPWREISVKRQLVLDGIQFTKKMVRNERKGTRDYIAERYQRQPWKDAVGKPACKRPDGPPPDFIPVSVRLDRIFDRMQEMSHPLLPEVAPAPSLAAAAF